jgi:hypothetical protein
VTRSVALSEFADPKVLAEFTALKPASTKKKHGSEALGRRKKVAVAGHSKLIATDKGAPFG